MSFVAQLSGSCRQCGAEIQGEEVEYHDQWDAPRGLVHVGCLDAFIEAGKVYCPDCGSEWMYDGPCTNCP